MSVLTEAAAIQSSHVRIDRSFEEVLIFRCLQGRVVRDNHGRQVIRAVIHFADAGFRQMLLPDPHRPNQHMIVEAIATKPVSVLRVEKISLVILDPRTKGIEIMVIEEECVVWPIAYS